MNIKILDIIKNIHEKIDIILGNENLEIKYISNINSTNLENSICYCNNKNIFEKNINKMSCDSLTIVDFPVLEFKNIIENKKINIIICENSRFLFSKIVNSFTNFPKNKISTKSFMGENVKIGKNCSIGDNCVIDNCIIGDNVKILSNCSIGNSGFGYTIFKNKIEKFPDFGIVKIGNNVEIHSNVCIDRGSLSDTIIGDNTKIDNLVHIAHNAEIGKNCFIIAGSVICGSSIIGDDCWISPGVKIIDGSKIANKTMIGIGSTVIKDITEENQVWVGTPAKFLRNRD